MGKMKMNKLLVEEDKLDISKGLYNVNFKKNSTIKISGEVTIESIIDSNVSLEFNLDNQTILKCSLVIYLQKNAKITFNLNDSSSLEFNLLIINEKNNKYEINVNMLGNNSRSLVKMHAINKGEKDLLDVICNGYVKDKTINNDLKEDLKGLVLYNDTIYIRPNMLIDTNEVTANHLVAISSFNLEELFYLTSRGLDLSSAKELLATSFIMRLVPDSCQNRVKMEVINNE